MYYIQNTTTVTKIFSGGISPRIKIIHLHTNSKSKKKKKEIEWSKNQVTIFACGYLFWKMLKYKLTSEYIFN